MCRSSNEKQKMGTNPDSKLLFVCLGRVELADVSCELFKDSSASHTARRTAGCLKTWSRHWMPISCSLMSCDCTNRSIAGTMALVASSDGAGSDLGGSKKWQEIRLVKGSDVNCQSKMQAEDEPNQETEKRYGLDAEICIRGILMSPHN